VRHGEVENPQGLIYGSLPGFFLSQRGRAQAAETARHLQSVMRGPFVILSSPLDRASETAQIVRDGLQSPVDICYDAELREAGSFTEGLPRRFAPVTYLGKLLDRRARAKNESPRQVRRRMLMALRGAVEQHVQHDLVVVSHQFPIWMASVGFERPTGLARHAPWLYIRRPCAYGSVTTLSFSAEIPTAAYWEPSA
jgi:broad specificity phosphatase PhoE